MPEALYKLDPRRTLALRGFDSLGAAAALHSATANGFTVSGVFRDAADFAVLVLYDADNFYEHPRLKYLPDFDFSGLTLSFDARYEGLMPLDSPKFPTIDWPYLSVRREDGSPALVRLFDYATQNGGMYTTASGSFTVVENLVKEFDRLTLWYLNYAFDYVVPKVECSFAFTATGVPGTVHWIEVAGVRYNVAEVLGDTNTSLTERLVAAADASPDVSATQVAGNQADLRNSRVDGSSYAVSASSGGTFTLHGVSAASVAANLAGQIASANYSGATIGLTASAAGATISISATRAGSDGNSIALYATAKNARLTTAQETASLSGGNSEATWRVTLDFTALGIASVREMWLTFAPPLAYGDAIAATEWRASFTNWSVSGPEMKKRLKVAGPDSVRVEEDDSWCGYTGAWTVEDGFFSKGLAKRSTTANQTVTVAYHCATTHDVWVGTSLGADRGSFGVRLDGDAETTLNCAMNSLAPVNTRRRVRTNVPPGAHTLVLRSSSAAPVYFDFLEAAVAADAPDAPPPVATMSPALDYSTDHTYKLPPSRILWSFDKLGFGGPMNEYIGVFWWNQRTRVGASIPSVEVTFPGTWVGGESIFLNIGGQAIGKSVFPGETATTFARHFAFAINATFVGVYATNSGGTLTITTRSPSPAYSFSFAATNASFTGSLSGGVPGKWQVDPNAATALNRAARDWHTDLFSECEAREREIVVASSMELVEPPSGFAAEFWDGAVVETAVGFGNLKSTHCAFSSAMREFHKRVFLELASLQAGAGLTPFVQLGEFVWWFFTNWSAANPGGGMAFYDAETKSQAATALGRPLHRFLAPTDSPLVNGSADATFLRNRLRDYAAALIAHVRAAYPSAKFELLYPYDVNYPVPAGANQLGGALNRFVNLPVEWEDKATAGFERLKMEALDFGAWSRDLNLCHATMAFPFSLDWPRDSVHYLAAVFRPGAPWEKEYLLARGLGIPVVNLWAYDQFALYGLDPREPRVRGRALSS